jgi:hypothetical protein
MRQIIESIKALIEAEGYPVYYVDVPDKPAYPYVLLWSGAGGERAESLADEDDYIDDRLGVTCVATLAESVLDMVPIVRKALNRAVVMTDSHTAWLRLRDSQTVQVDRDVALPGHGYPNFAVDIYRVIAEPAKSGSSA